MCFSPKPIAVIALLSFLAVPLGAWLVFGEHGQAASEEVPASGKALPAFWKETASTEDSPSTLMTHGGWFCGNPDCRFLKMSGGQPFRSAKAQACSLCRQPLIPDRPVAVVRERPVPTEPALTARGGG